MRRGVRLFGEKHTPGKRHLAEVQAAEQQFTWGGEHLQHLRAKLDGVAGLVQHVRFGAAGFGDAGLDVWQPLLHSGHDA